MSQPLPPPMSHQPPAPSAHYSSHPPGRTSAAAVTSLVLGILGCVPFVTGLLAVILGIVGIRKTRQSNIGGRGMAIAGLVLALVSLAGWGLLGGGLGIGYIRSKPARVVADLFTRISARGT